MSRSAYSAGKVSRKRSASRPRSAAAPTPSPTDLEAAVRFNQHLTQAVIDSLAAHVAVLDRDGTIISTNAAWTRFAHDNSPGLPQRTYVGTNYLAICHGASGEDSEGAVEVEAGIRDVLSGAVARFQHEYACHSPNEKRWFLLLATGLEHGARGAVLLHIDITERKLSEGKLLEAERLKVLTTGLLKGQDEERRRLARELHDGLNQGVSVLSIRLGVLAKQLHDPVRTEVQALQQRAMDLSEQVHRISHQLHPAILEHVGLGKAVRSLGEEFAEAHAIALQATVADELGDVDDGQSLCLYRVAQECLRNIASHAGATEAIVILRRSEEHVELVVNDNGRGFKTGRSSTGSGLGLASMEERVRLAGGRLVVKSEPGRGTSIEVRIPAVTKSG